MIAASVRFVCSLRDLLAMMRATFGRRSGGARMVDVRQLGGRRVALRDGTSDPVTAVSVFAGLYHRPPPGVEPTLIWDLGANIGLTMADFGVRYPGAFIVGVEPDAGNARTARRNIAFLGERTQLVQAAVWPVDGHVRLGDGSEAGFRVDEHGSRTVPAVSLNTLLARTGPPGYVKVDIEGSEEHVLRENTAWAASVRSISVECHPPYTMEQCRADLAHLGFEVTTFRQTSRRRAHDCVFGLRGAGA